MTSAPEASDLPTGWPGTVLRFWFDELGAKEWFTASQLADDAIAERFGDLPRRLGAVPTKSLSAAADIARASVIVLDQFPRNLFRDDARAFATDEQAREIAGAAISAGYDQGLSADEALFLYLPFEHSEDAEDQELAVQLISALGNDRYTEFAVRHREVITRFGRFPHRNAALGRQSTPEEQAFLAEDGRGF